MSQNIRITFSIFLLLMQDEKVLDNKLQALLIEDCISGMTVSFKCENCWTIFYTSNFNVKVGAGEGWKKENLVEKWRVVKNFSNSSVKGLEGV